MDSYFCFRLALLHSVCYYFFLYQSPFSSLCTAFDSISSNIDEVPSINPYVNVFVFVDFNVHHKDWLTVLCKLIKLVNFAIIFLSQMTLLRWLAFLLRSLMVTLTVLLFWIYFFLLTLVFVLQWLSLHWETLIMLVSQFPWTFHQTENGIFYFIAQPMAILVLIWTASVIIWEMFKRRISLNSVLLLLLGTFLSGFRLELMYIYPTSWVSGQT